MVRLADAISDSPSSAQQEPALWDYAARLGLRVSELSGPGSDGVYSARKSPDISP